MGLKTRIIAVVIVAFSVMNLFLCSYITHQVKTLELESLRAQIDKSTYLMKKINTLPLYNVDMDALKMNMETFFDDKNMKRFAIHDSELNINLNLIREFPLGGTDIKKSFVIDYNGLTLGSLTVVYSTSVIEKNLAKFRTKMLGVAFFVTLVMAVVLIFLITIITKPVARLARITSEITSGNIDKEIDQTRVGEVGILSRNFVRMRDAIKEKTEDLARTNTILEGEVQQKTLQEKKNLHQRMVISSVNTFFQRSMTAQSVKEIAKIFISIAQGVIPAPYCFVGLVCDREESLNILAFSDLVGKQYQKVNDASINQGFRQQISGKLLKTITDKTPLILNNVSLNPEFAFLPREHLPIDTIMALPMLHGEDVLGLVVFAGMEGKYTFEDQEVAMMMVMALVEALSLRTLQDEKQRFEEMVIRSQIASNMLSFSGRRNKMDFAVEDIALLLDQSLELASNESTLEDDFHFGVIQIMKDYDPDLPKVKCRGGEVKQVFFNILSNGAYAMAGNTDNPCPTFFMRTYGKEDQVCVEIRDNGPGMSENIRRHIFEPFFSTKPDKEGAGLGLLIANFIITENHKGTIDVESTLGEGTCFRIFLPTNLV
ncbi:ATP-binding protein [Desulfobacter postgatei]|uniref:ATP-binding protein n=1 Tax=Desulfobacter postgatei TaxID=2293 RepID=UPI00259B5552|nr:ATP-binding protein [uncultured Desulfobacter sp.]